MALKNDITALTDKELNQLLAPVPLVQQQRNHLVKVLLRHELAPNYVGPVELDDLRLTLSPWHWLRGELATCPQSIKISKALEAARLTGADPELDTVAGVTEWIHRQVNSEEEWCVHPSDPDYMEPPGELIRVLEEVSHFLTPSLDVVVVRFELHATRTDAAGFVIVETWWYDGVYRTSDIGIYRLLERSNDHGSGYAWLDANVYLLLIDSSTGQHAKLAALSVYADQSAGEDSQTWAGQQPQLYTQDVPSSGDKLCGSWLACGLHFEDGRLYRRDTGQELCFKTLTPGEQVFL